jgi:hypothetical protein
VNHLKAAIDRGKARTPRVAAPVQDSSPDQSLDASLRLSSIAQVLSLTTNTAAIPRSLVEVCIHAEETALSSDLFPPTTNEFLN